MPAADWSHHVYSFSHLSSVTGWKIINKNHLNTKKSRQDDSEARMPSTKTDDLGSGPRTHGRRRGPTPASCPLTSAHTLWHS